MMNSNKTSLNIEDGWKIITTLIHENIESKISGNIRFHISMNRDSCYSPTKYHV